MEVGEERTKRGGGEGVEMGLWRRVWAWSAGGLGWWG